jgi:lipopolysaccharide export system permease protein
MKILQRYILTELTGPFLMAVVVLTFVLLATQLFKLMEYLVSASISPFLLARFLGTLIPPILMLTLPMGLLVAVLLVFGRLSADRELMAIRTSGVNLKMLYFPVVIVGLVCTLLLFYFTHFLVPQNRLGLTQLKGEVTYLLQSALPAGRWHQPDAAGSDQVSLMFEDREGTSTLRKVGMHMLTSEGNDSGAKDQVIIMADRGWISPLPGSEGLHFLLKHGYIHIYDQYNPAAYVMVRFNRLDRDIRLEVDRVKKRGQDPEETPTPGLQSRLDFALSKSGSGTRCLLPRLPLFCLVCLWVS